MAQFDLNERSKRKSKKPIALALIKMTHAQEMALFAIYNRVVAMWVEAAHHIVAAYGASVADGSASDPGDVTRQINKTADDVARLMITIPVLLASWSSRVEKVHQAKWVRSVMAATKVDISGMLGPSDVNALLKASVDWNTALIKDVSSETQRRIANIVFSGFQQKSSVYDVAKEINKVTGMARKRARNIAYDQLNKLGAALNKARQQQAGIKHFQWIHSAKLHARPVHLARNGKVFPWEGPGSIAPDDMPSVPPFCGCTAKAVILVNA